MGSGTFKISVSRMWERYQKYSASLNLILIYQNLHVIYVIMILHHAPVSSTSKPLSNVIKVFYVPKPYPGATRITGAICISNVAELLLIIITFKFWYMVISNGIRGHP